MQLLQLVESIDHVVGSGELFGSFAQTCFDFKVFLEVIFAHFVVHTQEVVTLFYGVLETFPSVCHAFGRDGTQFFPLGLECFEGVVVFVDEFSICGQLFELFDDFEFARQVSLSFRFCFCRDFSTAHFDVG